MPDIVVHNAVGKEAFSRLPPEVKRDIKPEIFQFSLLGPDPYVVYRFFMRRFRHGVNLRARTMHRTKTGEYLMELARRSKSDEMFSYLAGFLCHYALDSTAHPLVYELQGDRGYMHMAIERRLDIIELERQGRQRRDIVKLLMPFPELPEVRDAMKKVYGWDDDYYKISYRHMKAFLWMTKDQHGLMNLLFGWTKGKYAALSFCNHLCDGIDLSAFDDLRREAVELAVKLISAAYDYRTGQIDEEKLRETIGNRSYAGGQAEDCDDDPRDG